MNDCGGRNNRTKSRKNNSPRRTTSAKLTQPAVARGLIRLLIFSTLIISTTLFLRNLVRARMESEDRVFVTEDMAAIEDGCDAVSVFQENSGGVIKRGETMISPGRMAISGKGDVVFASRANGIRTVEDLQTPNSSAKDIYVFLNDGGSDNWRSVALDSDVPVQQSGGIAISRDDQYLYVATKQNDSECKDVGWRGLAKFAINGIDWVNGRLGDPLIAAQTGMAVASIIPDMRGAKIYAIGINEVDRNRERRLAIYSLDANTLELTRDVIETRIRQTSIVQCSVGTVHASLSKDGKYMLINSWNASDLVLVDLEAGSASLRNIPGLTMIGGLSFNHQSPNDNMVAIHGINGIIVMRFESNGDMTEIARAAISPPDLTDDAPTGPKASIAWGNDGTRLIVAEGQTGEGEFSIWDLVDGQRLVRRAWIDACRQQDRNYQNDIITMNERRPAETATALPTASATDFSSATPLPSPTTTSTTATSPSPQVVPIYLPVSLRERCKPVRELIDVILAVDTSSSMEERTASGVRKLDAATAAATSFLGLLKLDAGDRAAVVTFNAQARLDQPLIADRTVLAAALARLTTAPLTCLPCAVEVSSAELEARRRPGVMSVLVLLTDGRSNPRPVSEAVDRARLAKMAGVTIFTVALGGDVDAAGLEEMASYPGAYLTVADAETLEAAYATIARTLPCPTGAFWGRR